MKQQSILVIEDDMTLHKLLSRILGSAGYKVYIVATCADGIKLALLHRPDCILLDFYLPDGDAASVCSVVKSDESTKKIPVIIFSSDPGVENAAYTQCHADKFILKGPGIFEGLPAAIEKILRSASSVRSDC